MFDKKKRLGLILPLLALTLTAVVSVKAVKTIRIDPFLPTPGGEFQIYVTEHTTSDPHIFIAMTKDTYEHLTGPVVVTWGSSGETTFWKPGDFHEAWSGKAPPSGTEQGCNYTVASLRDHLGVPNTEPVYWAMGPFLDGPITETAQTFRVTLPSTSEDPRMLVYAFGKVSESAFPDLFNNCVPPTIPGFVVPELSSIVLALASFGALAVYALKRRA